MQWSYQPTLPNSAVLDERCSVEAAAPANASVVSLISKPLDTAVNVVADYV